MISSIISVSVYFHYYTDQAVRFYTYCYVCENMFSGLRPLRSIGVISPFQFPTNPPQRKYFRHYYQRWLFFTCIGGNYYCLYYLRFHVITVDALKCLFTGVFFVTRFKFTLTIVSAFYGSTIANYRVTISLYSFVLMGM